MVGACTVSILTGIEQSIEILIASSAVVGIRPFDEPFSVALPIEKTSFADCPYPQPSTGVA